MLKLLIISLSIILFSGCSQKEKEIKLQVQTELIKQKVYKFKIVDINGAKIPIYTAYVSSPTIRIGVNAYVENVPNYEIRLAPTDVHNICKPYLNKAKGFYRGVTNFYEFQIDEYNKITKEENE